jgi:hypothetical protein
MSDIAGIVGRLVADRVGNKGRRRACDPSWQEATPLLHEVVTTELRDGHRLHDPASVAITGGDGVWVATLSIGYLAQSTRAEGLTVQAALDALEHALASGEARWSFWRDRRPRIGPKDDQQNAEDPVRNGKPKGRGK